MHSLKVLIALDAVFYLFLIGAQLLFNVVSVSAVQGSESTVFLPLGLPSAAHPTPLAHCNALS